MFKIIKFNLKGNQPNYIVPPLQGGTTGGARGAKKYLQSIQMHCYTTTDPPIIPLAKGGFSPPAELNPL